MNYASAVLRFLLRRLWIFALLAAIALIATDTRVHFGTTLDLSTHHANFHPAVDPFSPSGLAENQHLLILPYSGMDTYHWVLQTQAMLAGAGWRIRSVDYDNAPDGRDVHWSSLVRWWLGALAEVDHLYTSTPLAQSVEDMAPLGSVIMVLLFLLVMTPVFARRFGSVPAAFLAFGIFAICPLYESYMVGRTDHHALVALVGMLVVLCLAGGAAGWVRVADGEDESLLQVWLPDRPQARRWFIASGIIGGIGLWVSAASTVFTLAFTGIGALFATGLLARGIRTDEPVQPDPSLWRVWGWSGAATSLFCYFLEYFPSHLGLRLEVNHPLYALAWGGGGEIIFRISRWWGGRKLAECPRDWAWLAGGVLAVAAAPLIILLFGGQVFRVSDRFLWAMHVDYIGEFSALGKFLALQLNDNLLWKFIPLNFLLMANPLMLLGAFLLAWSGLRPWPARIAVFALSLLAFGICFWVWPEFHHAWLWGSFLAALLILAAGLWGSWAPFPRPLRALFLLTLPPAIVGFIQALNQVRWIETSFGLWLAALAIATLALQLHGKFRWNWPRLFAAVALLLWTLLPNCVVTVRNWILGDWKGSASQIEQLEVIARDVSQRLRDREGGNPVVIASGPTSSTWLIYYGGFKGLGTYYWENLAGMKANAEIYGARSPEQALKIMEEHHINYLVIFSWVDNPVEYTRLFRGLRADQPAPEDAFAFQLQHGGVHPSWLRPLFYQMPVGDEFKSLFVFIAEIIPRQSAPVAQVRLAQWELQLGDQVDASRSLEAALALDPVCLPAIITSARMDYAAGKMTEFATRIQRLRELLPQAGALDFDDRVDLATILALAKENTLLRAQMELCLPQAGLLDLRRLRPEALYNFLSIAHQLDLFNLRPGLWAMASPILPPPVRAQLLFQFTSSDNTAQNLAANLALLRQASMLDPNSVPVLGRLAWILATTSNDTVRNGQEAVTLASHARELGKNPNLAIVDTLACAYAETGDFNRAVDLELQAIAMAQIAKAQNTTDVVAQLNARLALFQKNKPYRE